jgi:hypothetical protein
MGSGITMAKKAPRVRKPRSIASHPLANLSEVKVLSVPAIFGKRLPVKGDIGRIYRLMRVCGRLRRVSIVGGTRGYGVRLYGDFFASYDENTVHSRIAFLPDPISSEAMRARSITPLGDEQYFELDCDVWALEDIAAPAGARLQAVGTVTAPADPLQALFIRSRARAEYAPTFED